MSRASSEGESWMDRFRHTGQRRMEATSRTFRSSVVSGAVGGQMSDGVRADVLTGAGVLAFLQCDYQTAAERLRQAHALYERQGHLAGTATTLQFLGAIAREQG